MSRVTALLTIPHTGTHAMHATIGNHPDIFPMVPVHGILNGAIRLVVSGCISLDVFEDAVIWLACEQEKKSIEFNKLYDDFMTVLKSNIECDRKCACIYGHIQPPKYDNKYWMRELLDFGWSPKIVASMRDPIAAVLTQMRQMGDPYSENATYWLDILAELYSYVTSLYNKGLVFAFPVDLMAAWTSEERLEHFNKFTRWAGISDWIPDKELYIYKWNPTHPTPIGNDKISNITMAYRTGARINGMDSIVDREIERYSSMHRSIAMLESLGYVLRWKR